MPRFAANIDWMFCEMPFLERFEAAAGAGFEGVEFLFPYGYPADLIADLLDCYGLTNVLFNFPAGNWHGGERGIAALPGRESEFRDSVELAISYADALNTIRLHVLAGIVPTESRRAEYSEVYLQNLRYAADRSRRVALACWSRPSIPLTCRTIWFKPRPNRSSCARPQAERMCGCNSISTIR